MINNVTLVGRMTRDPELRKTNSGKSILSFTLAVNRKFKSEGQADADFIRIKAWGQTADFVARYMNQGDLLGVEGRIETGSYEDVKTGMTVYTTEVVANSIQGLESKKEKENRNPSPSLSSSGYNPDNITLDEPDDIDEGFVTGLDITSDDLPF